MDVKMLFDNLKKSGDFQPQSFVNDEVALLNANPYTPVQIRNAYAFPPSGGRGQTIAIIIAYGSPTIVKDTAVFGKRFQLPPVNLEVVYPQGIPQTYDAGWAVETSLDVQWAYALAPFAKILLVVAKDNSNENLFSAVEYAVSLGATIVSMSWGAPEYKEQLADDNYFKAPGVTFLAAAGDMGSSMSYPSTSPYVVAVGGTYVQLTTNGTRIAPEISWYDSGGGVSKYEPKPNWQYIKNDAQPKTNTRTIPDVAFFADPYPGVYVYITIPTIGRSMWLGVGGTSVSTICWAAALAHLQRETLARYPMPATLYKLAGGSRYTNPYGIYYDAKNGNNGYYPCITGYDYVTGLGTPIVANLLRTLEQ